MENLSPFVVVEKRVNLHHFPLKFGKQNATEIDMVANTIEDDCCEEKFLQIANYFQHFFNAKYSTDSLKPRHMFSFLASR
jgi:hypothetical protein